MATPYNSPDLGDTDQGPAGGGGGGLPPLASPGPAQDQAAAFWNPPPIPEGDPRGANEELCRLGLRVEGGYLRPWDEVPPGEGEESWARGLGPSKDPLRRGSLWRDREWSHDEVRAMWTLEAVNEGFWDDLQDSQPYWD